MKDKINLQKKKIIAGVVFLAAALFMSTIVPTVQMSWVMGLLILTIYLFAFEVLEVDVTAISIMVLLGLSTLFAPIMGLEEGLVSTDNLFDGFSSNAVMSIIAVMIIGAGLDKTGIMSKVASFILDVGGTSEKRIIPIVSSTVGFISSFMQNVGAAALFIPVVSRISARSGLPMSRLLMPMGFCAILGGTVTMVGSSPLILLNDLILTTNQGLPETQQMETWGLFSVTPIGVALVFTGIFYFVLAGRFVLPKVTEKADANTATNTMDYFQNIYGIDYAMFELVVPADSHLVGHVLNDIEQEGKIRIIAAIKGNTKDVTIGANGVARDYTIEANTVLGILGSEDYIKEFAKDYKIEVKNDLEFFQDTLSSARSGVAEVVIPPGSQLIDKSARDVWLRKTYGLAMVALHREGETLSAGEGIRDLPFQAGDTLVVHTLWSNLDHITKDKNFVVVTTEYPHEENRPQKIVPALFFFTIALSMVLFTDLKLSVALLTGAVGMVLSGVLKIDEAYEAVSWKTVFLLASLIPLGLAVQSSGTAGWIAEQTLKVVGDMPVWVIQLSIAVLATFFTLVMSNVGATVLLVPLAVNIALGVEGANPAVFALTVAIATSNSFLIPTHQVNALIMGPGGYRVPDFMRAGGVMTILFLIVMTVMMSIVF